MDFANFYQWIQRGDPAASHPFANRKVNIMTELDLADLKADRKKLADQLQAVLELNKELTEGEEIIVEDAKAKLAHIDKIIDQQERYKRWGV